MSPDPLPPHRKNGQQRPVLDFLRAHHPRSFTYYDLGDHLGLTRESARWALGRLMALGLVERTPPTDNTRRVRFRAVLRGQA